VSVLDTTTGAVLHAVPLGEAPVALAVDERTGHVFVPTVDRRACARGALPWYKRRYRDARRQHGDGHAHRHASDSSVSVLDVGSGQLVRTIRVVQNPTVVTIDEQTGHIFVASNDVSNGASSSLESNFDTPLLDRIAASLHNSIRTLRKGRTGSVSILNVNTGP
jgi:DNA-binding beta-propeller fold protein YncE